MNTPKYTPGPWTASNSHKTGQQNVWSWGDDEPQNRKLVCEVWPSDTTIADAKLIAAAPDLLATLQELRAYADLKVQGHRQDYPEHHCMVQTALRMIELADKAIAKAIQ